MGEIGMTIAIATALAAGVGLLVGSNQSRQKNRAVVLTDEKKRGHR